MIASLAVCTWNVTHVLWVKSMSTSTYVDPRTVKFLPAQHRIHVLSLFVYCVLSNWLVCFLFMLLMIQCLFLNDYNVVLFLFHVSPAIWHCRCTRDATIVSFIVDSTVMLHDFTSIKSDFNTNTATCLYGYIRHSSLELLPLKSFRISGNYKRPLGFRGSNCSICSVL